LGQDDDLQLIASALDRYVADNPGATAELYRRGTYLVRVRVVDSRFARMGHDQRHQAVYSYLDQLPDEVASQVTYLVAITPGERQAGSSLEFDNPFPPGEPLTRFDMRHPFPEGMPPNTVLGVPPHDLYAEPADPTQPRSPKNAYTGETIPPRPTSP
jgi:hypothetical protein